MSCKPMKTRMKEMEMANETDDKVYPVKSLHDFLFELDREWSKFRNGTLISLFSSGILFVIVLWLLLRIRHLGLGLVDFVLLIFAGIFLGYSIYAMYSQFRFFNRWERRMGLLLHMESELLEKKLDEKS
jgi:hypothetical protein